MQMFKSSCAQVATFHEASVTVLAEILSCGSCNASAPIGDRWSWSSVGLQIPTDLAGSHVLALVTLPFSFSSLRAFQQSASLVLGLARIRSRRWKVDWRPPGSVLRQGDVEGYRQVWQATVPRVEGVSELVALVQFGFVGCPKVCRTEEVFGGWTGFCRCEEQRFHHRGVTHAVLCVRVVCVTCCQAKCLPFGTRMVLFLLHSARVMLWDFVRSHKIQQNCFFWHPEGRIDDSRVCQEVAWKQWASCIGFGHFHSKLQLMGGSFLWNILVTRANLSFVRFFFTTVFQSICLR